MNNLFKINGNPEQYEDLDVFHKLAQQFLPYAQQSLGFDKPVGVNLLSDPENVKDPLGKTAYYDPNKMEITLFVDKRHVKDVLRSMAHELVHHTQNCRGEFDGGVETGPGYAQDDEHMRKMEAEAYLKGSGFLLRDWEDSLKENKTMSKLNEKKRGDENWGPATLSQVLEFYNKTASSDESFRQLVMNYLETAADNRGTTTDPLSEPQQAAADLFSGSEEQLAAVLADDPEEKALASAPPETPLFGDDPEDRAMATGRPPGPPLEEGEGALCEMCGGSGVHESHCPGKRDAMEEGEIPAGLKAYQDDKKGEKESPHAGKTGEEAHPGETCDEAHGEEKSDSKKPDEDGDGVPDWADKNENWMKGNKDQLLFERLVSKWAK
mgnify:FL=1